MNVLYLHRRDNFDTLKYSLRSVEKFLSYDTVYVVGYKPKYLINVVHIPVKRRRNRYEDSNHKVNVGLSEIPKGETLLMHDDFYLLKEYEPIKYYNGLFKDVSIGGGRGRVFENTRKYLDEDAKNYGLHYPMPFINKGFDFDEPVSYMNILGNQPEFESKEVEDCKWKFPNEKQREGLPSFSTNSESYVLEEQFLNLYPKKSIFEK